MKWPTILLALLSTTSTVSASPSRKHHQFLRANGLLPRDDVIVAPPATKPQYLTAKTKKYAVDGANIPEVHFDIGESYSGLLDVDDSGQQLFFWFVPTTNPAAKNEITIWLNGGPGCSSLDGFLHENGPVIWQAGTYLPVRNTYAWSNLTNLVWVEQPVGTGYSQGNVTAKSEEDVAEQFNKFWKNFMELFDLQGRKVYIAGESYAGQYVPYIADAMIKENNKQYYDLSGILIYDPSIGYDAVTEEAPAVAFVNANRMDFPFNDSFVEYIEQKSQSCGYDKFLEEGLQFPPKGHFGPPPGTNKNFETTKECDLFDDIFRAIFKINPCYDIYQVGQLCPLLWDVLGFPYSSFHLPIGYKNPYFNRTDVKQAIHAPLDVNWKICSDEAVFVNDNDESPPSGLNGGPLARVAEHTNNVIVGHGAIDMVLILNGTLLTLNNLTWNGAQGFSAAPTKPFYVPYHYEPRKSSAAGAGVFGSWQTDRGLTFVSIDLSGHEVPEYQPSAGYRTLELLLGRINSLSDRSAFSTQPGYPQPKGPLGKGNGPI